MTASNPSLTRYLVLISLALLLLVSAAPVASAQQQDDDSDHASPSPYINLSLHLDNDGTASVDFSGYLENASVREFKPAIEAALGCQLQDSPRYRESSYFYAAHCSLPFHKFGLVREAKFDPSAILAVASRYGVDNFSVQFILPDMPVAETLPPPPQAALPDRPEYQRATQLLRRQHFYLWSSRLPGPPEVQLRFGYPAGAWHRAAVILGFFLIFPILLVYWLGRRALDAPPSNVATIWFSYLRYLQWTLNGSWILWWAAIESVDLTRILRFALSNRQTPLTWLLSGVIAWTPPALIWIGCLVLSRPVQEKLRGIVWTDRERTLQALYSFCGSLLPIALWIGAISALAMNSFRTAVVLFILGFVVLVVAKGKLARLLGMQPQALTSGDLRDVAFAIAARLGVKLQQIYVVPAGRGRMANAFARTGNTIAFTDFLLSRMSKREVNFVIAHELTHLRLNHPSKLAVATVVAAGGIVTILSVASFAFLQSPFLRYALIFAVTILAVYVCSRRFEYAADRGAVAATNDPAAAISALFKLASLNMHPMQWSKWSEKWVTHPSTMRRAQAIARQAGIPDVQIEQIGNTPLHPAVNYAMPASVLPGQRVLTTTKRVSNLRWIAFSLLASVICTPAIFALAAQSSLWTISQRNALYAVGAAATVAIYFSLANSLSTRSLKSLIPSLKARLKESAGIDADAWQGVPVGLAPADRPRIYEGHTHWDLGFLFTRSDRVCYWGEEARFALQRQQITDVGLGPGSPSWFRNRRIYIAWKDEQRQTSGVFSVASAYPETALALRKRTATLFDDLNKWRMNSPAARPLPEPLANLESPDFGEVTGHNPATLMNAAKLFKELWLTALLAAMGGVLFGLPFHLMEYLFGMGATAGVAYEGPGAGWYVVAVAVGIRLFQFLPFLFYKDRPALQAPSGHQPNASATSTSLGGSTAPRKETASFSLKG